MIIPYEVENTILPKSTIELFHLMTLLSVEHFISLIVHVAFIVTIY